MQRRQRDGRQTGEFHACTPEAIDAFVRHYDETVALYHGGDDDTSDADGDANVGLGGAGGGGGRGRGGGDGKGGQQQLGGITGAVPAPTEAGWFTTLARQMAATIQVGRCRLAVSKPVLKLPMVSALEARI